RAWFFFFQAEDGIRGFHVTGVQTCALPISTAPTVTWESVPWPVYAVSPRASTEPSEANRDAVISGLQVFAPADGPRPGPNDRVSHGGEEWGVVGDVGVWDNNPHFARTTQRGIVVNLDRTEG